MSYFIATSIVLDKNEITFRGGDNNVVPRCNSHGSFKNTPEEWRCFIKEDLLGGCIRPTNSANDYFWWWIMQRPMWEGLDYDTITDEQCDAIALQIQTEWKYRSSRQRYYIQFYAGSYLTYKRGCFFSSKTPVYMSLYKATYVLQEYKRTYHFEDVFIYKY